MIPPEQNGSFVANMEMVLDVYKRPFDPLHPIICMDESPKQLISETRKPIPAAPGRSAKYDYEYKRCGMSNIFLACEPLAGKRMIKVTDRRTALDWAGFIEEIAAQYEQAEKITLVMDNLNTHNAGSFYEKFPPEKAKALWDRFEFVHTPKHGSWLNIAEIELNVLWGQCLKRRIDDIETVRKEAVAWQDIRNNKNAKVNWQFTTADARVKLSRLYPTLNIRIAVDLLCSKTGPNFPIDRSAHLGACKILLEKSINNPGNLKRQCGLFLVSHLLLEPCHPQPGGLVAGTDIYSPIKTSDGFLVSIHQH